MKVTATRIIESCLDGTNDIEMTVDRPTGPAFIRYLAVLGRLEYFSDFPSPFYRVTRPGAFIVKGVEGSGTFRVFIIHNPDEVCHEIDTAVSRFTSS